MLTKKLVIDFQLHYGIVVGRLNKGCNSHRRYKKHRSMLSRGDRLRRLHQTLTQTSSNSNYSTNILLVPTLTLANVISTHPVNSQSECAFNCLVRKDVLDLNTNIAQTVYLEIANSVTPARIKSGCFLSMLTYNNRWIKLTKHF